LLILGLSAAIITSVAPDSVIFKSLMVTVIIDVILLINATNSKIGSFVV
jgi:hypothetical protein